VYYPLILYLSGMLIRPGYYKAKAEDKASSISRPKAKANAEVNVWNNFKLYFLYF